MSGPGEGVLWVASEQTLDGPYVVSFCHGVHAWVRTPSECLAYASAVVAAAHRADHDAAVVRQMISVGVTPDEAGHLMLELRADRPPLAGLAPLDLQLGVSGDGEYHPFLIVVVHGEVVGQWTVGDALDHAGVVLGMVATADLDNAYRALLLSTGLDSAGARLPWASSRRSARG